MAKDLMTGVTAKLVVAAGALFYVIYLVWLPFAGAIDLGAGEQTGILLYCLATAGAAFVAWGMILAGLDGKGVSRDKVLLASAVGFWMLSLMRLGTGLFVHPPFEAIRFIPFSEFVVFAAVAVKLNSMRQS